MPTKKKAATRKQRGRAPARKSKKKSARKKVSKQTRKAPSRGDGKSKKPRRDVGAVKKSSSRLKRAEKTKTFTSPGFGDIENRVYEFKLPRAIYFTAEEADPVVITQSLNAIFQGPALDVFRENRRRKFLPKLLTKEKSITGATVESAHTYERTRADKKETFLRMLNELFAHFASTLVEYLKRKSKYKIGVYGLAIEVIVNDRKNVIGNPEKQKARARSQRKRAGNKASKKVRAKKGVRRR